MPRRRVEKAGLPQAKQGIARIVVLGAVVVSFLLAPVAQTASGEIIVDHVWSLTVTKSPDPSSGNGTGTVSSKPKGVLCGPSCNEVFLPHFPPGISVVLTATPSKESTFVEWTGACSGSAPTCTVLTHGGLGAEEVVTAVFAGSSKAFSPAEALTLSKGESTGEGTVKAYGSLACVAACFETTVLYPGPVTKPKLKVGKLVVLKQAPAFGSKFLGWSGCDAVNGEGNCEVRMEDDREVTAEYERLSYKALRVEKEYKGGRGTVTSKPKGIRCGTTCTSASAAIPEGVSILLTAKPASTEPTTSFVKWEGGDCEGLVTATCTVTMDKAETVKAIFSGPVQAIANPQKLTLTKAGSGYGAVKASGLNCEVLCTTATSLYAGPITEPRVKTGASVLLKAISAPGSRTVEWSAG